MAKISIQDIQNVARLARIELSEKEQVSLSLELSGILQFVDTIAEFKSEGVEPTAQVTGLKDVWREDVVVSSKIPREKMLASAPMSQDGYIVVKKVL